MIRAGAMSRPPTISITPLALSCVNASAAIIERLLQAGANPDIAVKVGPMPLIACARNGNVGGTNALLDRDSGDEHRRQEARSIAEAAAIFRG